VRLDDTPEAREEGLTAFLLGEVMRQYQQQGYAAIEIQSPAIDAKLAEILTKLGLENYDEAALWLKGP
ncbi:MAG TPA: hypothetical protein VJ809_02545, partial [Pirellulales bacterium]|nr:hypothetical protein [Pirellulales bacterium]